MSEKKERFFSSYEALEDEGILERPKKLCFSDMMASWGQHVRFRVPTCPPETEPKSVFLDVQEGTYLKIAENVKI